MGGRALMVVLLGILAISSRYFLQITTLSGDMMSSLDRDYKVKTAANIAQTGVNLGVRKVLDDPTWRAGLSIDKIFDGQVDVTVSDTLYCGDTVIMVRATGTVLAGTPNAHSETAAAFMYGEYIPGTLPAAITSKHCVSDSTSFEIDGRDHDSDGSLGSDGGCGKPAVWTCKTFTQTGGGQTGGTDDEGDDHPPNASTDTMVCRENQSWPGGYPGTPDSVITDSHGRCMKDGTLKSIAKSGACGSQYTTDPSTLQHPLSGVTYVDLPAGTSWTGGTVDGSGILIVHNDSRDADLRDCNSGTFKGLVISDEIHHICSSIVGAVVCIGDSDDDVSGNGGHVLYCNKTVKKACVTAVQHSPGSSGKWSCGVIAWKE